MIKRSDVRYYGGTNPDNGEKDRELPTKFDMIVTSADCAFKDEKNSDYVAIGTVGVKGPDRFVLEIVNKHLDLPATENEILRQKQKWGSNVTLIEDKANGSAIIKSVKRKISGVVAVEPEGGKTARFVASTGEWQAGNWFVDRNAAWAEPFIDQIIKFPSAKYDDMADFMTQACIYLQRRSYVYGLTEYIKAQEEEMANKTKKKLKSNTPANVTTEDLQQIAKIDNPSTLTKPEIDDNTPRCESCGSTFIQRTPKGKRCGQCGLEFGLPQLNRPAVTNFGDFRK